jgi:transcriptional antiterminator RfaH
MTSAHSHWQVVQTHSHAEEKTGAHLKRQGYHVYLPRYLKRQRHARRIENVSAPLFARYLFVAIDRMTQRWRSIQLTTECVAILLDLLGRKARVVLDGRLVAAG